MLLVHNHGKEHCLRLRMAQKPSVQQGCDMRWQHNRGRHRQNARYRECGPPHAPAGREGGHCEPRLSPQNQGSDHCHPTEHGSRHWRRAMPDETQDAMGGVDCGCQPRCRHRPSPKARGHNRYHGRWHAAPQRSAHSPHHGLRLRPHALRRLASALGQP